jgi:PPK2 family polyphosphate:nucleotide phosphotransferase
MNRYRIKPGSTVNLNKWNADETGAFKGNKDAAAKKLVKLNEQLDELQDLLFAERKHKLLIVLQAMDTGGKDGVIRHVFENVDPLGVRVANFKAPTPEELDHDYLWRVHKQMPGRGEIVIFNRSHYEDVLVVRVHELVPKDVWSKRYDQINNFERLLIDEGTTILKFFLHISKKEQAERLRARLDDSTKRWKFNPGDLKERERWSEYMAAYEDALSQTSTDWAPWYVIPANRKWYRNLAVATIIVETLKNLKMQYPKPDFDPATIKIK